MGKGHALKKDKQIINFEVSIIESKQSKNSHY